MMELGATVCTPRSRPMLTLPCGRFLQSSQVQGLTEVIPEKRNERSVVEVTLASLVLVDRAEKLYLSPPKSAADQEFERGRWRAPVSNVAFPHNPDKKGSSSGTTIIREKLAFFGKNLPATLQPIPRVRHTVTYRQITLFPFRLEVAKLPHKSQTKILPLDDLNSIPVSNLTRKVARAALSLQKLSEFYNYSLLRLSSSEPVRLSYRLDCARPLKSAVVLS